MAILGTRQFWMSPKNMQGTQQDLQILKNSCYINIQIHSVHYKSDGDIFQRYFGGTNKVALITNVKYPTSTKGPIESEAVQDFREVGIHGTYNLSLQRNIAVKIPANPDALQLSVKITAVRDDKLQAKFDMLNSPEFQSALQLAPPVVGQAVLISSLVKKLLTDEKKVVKLEADYAGMISAEKDPHDLTPASNGKLTSGFLILIAIDDDSSVTQWDENNFRLEGDTLKYRGNDVKNTYVIFNISYDTVKGPDQDSHWFKKYADALSYLDKLASTTDKDEIVKIVDESKNIWREANAIFDTDATYLFSEKWKIKMSMLNEIKARTAGMTTAVLPKVKMGFSLDDISQIVDDSTTLNSMSRALPRTSAFLRQQLKIDPNVPLRSESLSDIHFSGKSTAAVLGDTKNYLQNLKLNGIKFDLNLIK